MGGTGSKGAEEAAADVCDDLAEQGFAGTSDFSLCCDHMGADVTCDLITEAGWPEDIMDLCKQMWGEQERWLIWNGHVAEDKKK